MKMKMKKTNKFFSINISLACFPFDFGPLHCSYFFIKSIKIEESVSTVMNG